MGRLAEASSGSRGAPLPCIFLDQTKDKSVKKIFFWIKLLLPPPPPTPPLLSEGSDLPL